MATTGKSEKNALHVEMSILESWKSCEKTVSCRHFQVAHMSNLVSTSNRLKIKGFSNLSKMLIRMRNTDGCA
jgi:hypothetical protein